MKHLNISWKKEEKRKVSYCHGNRNIWIYMKKWKYANVKCVKKMKDISWKKADDSRNISSEAALEKQKKWEDEEEKWNENENNDNERRRKMFWRNEMKSME